jgi:hypothetical protein
VPAQVAAVPAVPTQPEAPAMPVAPQAPTQPAAPTPVVAPNMPTPPQPPAAYYYLYAIPMPAMPEGSAQGGATAPQGQPMVMPVPSARLRYAANASS